MAASSQSSISMKTPFGIGADIWKAGAEGDIINLAVIRGTYRDRDLKQICDVYCDCDYGWRVLHKVAKAGYVDACDFLIKYFRADVNIQSFSGDTPLILAAEGEHVKVVKCLLDHGALVNVMNNRGFTPLHRAIQQDNIEIMYLLLEKKAATDINSVEGTVLQIAASRGNVEAVKLLLEKGAEPNAISTSTPTTPLMCSIEAQSFDCMMCLLEANADVRKFACGLTVLGYAAKQRDTKFLKHLLGVEGVDPNQECSGGLKPIEHAALAHNREAIEMLLQETVPIESYPKWTTVGILDYCHSMFGRQNREMERILRYRRAVRLGKTKMDEKDFAGAAELYGQACYLDPKNTKWQSMRIKCNVRAGRRVEALHDADMVAVVKKHPVNCCSRICPRPHNTAGAGHVPSLQRQLYMRYHNASVAFHLSPNDNEIRDSYSVALSQYFSWLHSGTCQQDLLNFLENFL